MSQPCTTSASIRSGGKTKFRSILWPKVSCLHCMYWFVALPRIQCGQRHTPYPTLRCCLDYQSEAMEYIHETQYSITHKLTMLLIHVPQQRQNAPGHIRERFESRDL